MTPILRELVIRSSLPLKAVEVDFAPDSTGFSTNRFVKWYDEKYGVQRSGHDWVKVHIMTGVKTNIVTAVEIHGRDAADSPLLPPMLATTAKNFTIHEVSADKGYSGVENTEAVFQAGGTPFIAYKANTTGAAGGLWEKMFHFFQYRREEFLTHYHKRSNVESTFSMMKAKFRDGVRAKTDVAMVNEALCKIICHNICCVIQCSASWASKRNSGRMTRRASGPTCCRWCGRIPHHRTAFCTTGDWVWISVAQSQFMQASRLHHG